MDEKDKLRLAANQTLERLRNEEEGVLRQIYTDHFGACYRKVTAAGGSLEDCREVFQEALYALLVRAQDPDFVFTSSLQAYLVQTCFYLWLKERKQLRKLVPLVDQNEQIEVINPQLIFEREERTYTALYGALRKLTGACQKVLEAFFVKRQTDKEIAVAMNYTAKFAKTKRHRCLDNLRDLVHEKMANE